MSDTTSLAAASGHAAAPGDVANPDAFISYSHLDRAFAVRLRDALRAHGKNAWLDETEIHGGTRWSDALQRAIQTADAFLFVLSPHSAASRECGAELAHALTLNKRILPLRAADTPLESLPPGLADYQFIPGRRLFTDDFDASLAQLITEIETDRDWVREHTDWSEKAGEWDQHHRNHSYLLAGAELEAAESWRSRAAGKRPGLSTLQSEFIDASRQWATRRLRRTRTFVSVALVVALGLTILAFILRQQAVSEGKTANSGRLAAQSLLALTTDPQLSLLLSVQAAQVQETPEALDALRNAIPANHLLRTVSADGQPLDSAQWSSDGTMVATASSDGYARVYDAATGRLIRRFPLGAVGSGGALFTDSDHELLTWGGDVRIWNIATGAAVATPSDPSLSAQIEDVAVNRAGTLFATAAGPGASGAALLWNARTGRLLHVLERASLGSTASSGALPPTLSFSPDGRLLAGGSENGTATVWNTATGAVVRTLNLERPGPAGPQPYVDSTVFSPNGKSLATSNQDGNNIGQTVIWHVSDWSFRTVNGVAPAWSPGSSFVATTGEQGIVKVYVAATGKEYAHFPAHAPATEPVSIGPDVNNQLGDVLTGSQSGTAEVWSSYSGGVVETLGGDAGLTVPAGYSPDGSRILTWSSDGSARIWDSGQTAGQPVAAPPAVRALAGSQTEFLQGRSYDEPADILSPLRAFTSTRGLRVINVRTGAVLADIAPDGATFGVAAFDGAGRVLAVARSSLKGAVTEPAEIRRARGGALRHVLSGPGSRALGVAVSPDGKLVAAVDGTGAIGVWDVVSGRQLAVFHRDVGAKGNTETGQVDLWFSPDSTLIVSGDMYGRTFVWRPRTGAVVAKLPGLAEPPAGQFLGVDDAISPDDRLVVVSRSWQNTASVYRVGSGQLVTTLQGAALPIAGVAFNADGSLIAAVADDDTIRVWDTQHSSPLFTGQLRIGATSVAFTGDGRSLADNGDAAFPYETVPCAICGGFPQLLSAARQRERRGLTSEERSQYLHN